MQVCDRAHWRAEWRIEKYWGDITEGSTPYDVVEIPGNVLLDAGITALWNAAATGGTQFDAAHARIGVGNSTTAAAHGQTGLQGGSQAFASMNASYPSVSGQSITFQADFGTAAANFAWQECVVDNGTTTLNRKVSSQGTKTSAETWRAVCTITLS